MTSLVFWKCVFLFLAILYGFGNAVRGFHKCNITAGQLILMTVGIVGFVYLQFWR